MTTTVGETDLAWAKALHDLPLSLEQKRLAALELARRAQVAGSDHPTTGREWRILRRIAIGPNIGNTFAELVAAYDDWSACRDDVEEWRHRSDVVDTDPMSSERAFEYVQEHLDDAVAVLVGGS